MPGMYDPEESQRLCDEGIRRVSVNNVDFLDMMRTEAKRISREQGVVSSDSLRQYGAAHNITPTHPNAWGAIFREKGWETLGFTKSVVPSCHARTIRLWKWRGKDSHA